MSDMKDPITIHTASKEPDAVQSSVQDALTSPSVQPEAAGPDASGVERAESTQRAGKKKGFLSYFMTRDFYIVLVLGQVLAIANTATSTFTSLLSIQGNSIPAFQTFFNYVLLNLVFTPYTIYRYGFKGWLRVLLHDCWKYFILAFCDVEGNYFIVLAYRYTNMLSAQLINFWAIAVVVILSFLFLHVRYHITQIVGILIAIGGVGILIASDHITGNSGTATDQLKGDLFALLGATFYGACNTAEEFFVSKRPVYEVLGMMSFFGMLINGTQAAIFDRHSFRVSVWNGKVGGYFTGYTLCLFLFYCLAPLMFRLSSAAFFNISMLTMNFWGVCIGVKVLHEHIHWMYPIAFVCIILGQIIYFVGRQVLGEAVKPWLGRNQERGVVGLFTAKKRIVDDPDAVAAAGVVVEDNTPVAETGTVTVTGTEMDRARETNRNTSPV